MTRNYAAIRERNIDRGIARRARPGNRHRIERPILMLVPPGPIDQRPLAQIEIEHIRRVLASQNNDVTAAARVLGISRTTLYRKLRQPIKYVLDPMNQSQSESTAPSRARSK